MKRKHKSDKLPVALVSTIVALLALLFTQAAYAENNMRKQMRVRAAFVFQMSKFVNWQIDKNQPLVFCLFPDTRPYNELVVLSKLESQGKLVSQGHKVKTRVIDVNLMDKAEHYDPCSLIYFNNNADSKVPTSLFRVLGNNKLVVGGNLAFIKKGGLTALVYEKGKHKLYIHRSNYESSFVKIRSRLLSLARFYPE